MKIINLLKNIDFELICGNTDLEVEDISYDSRKVNEKIAFVALKGIDVDGHDFILSAIEKGCKCIIVCENVKPINGITIIKINDTRMQLSFLSANLFGNPQDKLIKIGITGTKGKTSISYMLKSILEQSNNKVGIIGTNGTLIDGINYPHKNTTPESYLIQKYMKQMVDVNTKYLIMEVSSQALKVGRVNNIIFDYAIMTNISHDHVGPREHPSFEDYVESKAKLFSQSKICILNHDDEYYEYMKNKCTGKLFSYGKENSDLNISDVLCLNNDNKFGMSFKTNGIINDEFYINIPGEFNVYNATSAILLANLLKINNQEIKKSLQNIFVEGRTEIIELPNKAKVVIDYAHNKLSIESIIKTMKEFEHHQIITVFGVGGGRSRELRKEIGSSVGKNSDVCIITCDNPRNDDLNEINEDILSGILEFNKNYKIIPDRTDAIMYALANSQKNDIILLLGKGHEKFQEIKGKIYDLDERKIINEYLGGFNGNCKI